MKKIAETSKIHSVCTPSIATIYDNIDRFTSDLQDASACRGS